MDQSTYFLVLFLTGFGQFVAYPLPYDGDKVLSIFPKNASDLKNILAMELPYNLDFWHFPRSVNDSLHVHVEKAFLHGFLTEIKRMGLEVKVSVENVGRLFDMERKGIRSRRQASPSFDFKTYNTLDAIYAYIDSLPSSDHGVRVIVKTIGTTHENRLIKVVKIHRYQDDNIKSNIVIDGGIHAREWISPATVVYFINQLVYNTDAETETLLKYFDWHIIPVLNPDGYAYSWSSSNTRFWRKNRSPKRRGCYGVDLNRNFDYNWNPDVGGSKNPCSDIYAGTHGLSEPESQALSSHLSNLGTTTIAYLTVHSFGQMWLTPWGYTPNEPNDYSQLYAAANAGASALKAIHGTSYRLGTSTGVLYSAAGGSDDYAKGRHKAKYSYTLELRDTSTFELPVEQIVPTCEETWAGLVAFANHLITHHCTSTNSQCQW